MTDGRPAALVDGRPARRGTLARLRRRGQRLLVTRTEQDEAELERQLFTQPGVTRANVVALISPSGGVGKTTCAFVIANLLASHLKLRTVAVDANPGFGSLAQLVPDAAARTGTHRPPCRFRSPSDRCRVRSICLAASQRPARDRRTRGSQRNGPGRTSTARRLRCCPASTTSCC